MHVAVSLVTLASGGGTGTGAYVRGLLGEFARGNGPDEVTVLVHEDRVGGLGELGDGRLSVAALPSAGAARVPRLAALTPAWLHGRGVARTLQQVDVLHYPLTIPAPRARVPCVLTLHDVQHHDLPELFTRAQRLWRARVYDSAARRAEVVITDSWHAKGRIVERLGVAPERIEVAHLGIDTDRFTPDDPEDDTEALSGFELPERFLLYPAGLWSHKNHDRLLAAMASVADQDLGLVLTGPDFGRRELLIESVAHHRLETRVRYLGFVAPYAVPPLYRRATALVFPSLYEGFGAPPLEAMACGCPVACSSAASLPEICGGAALMFDPHDTESIAAAIERIVTDGDLRARLRRAGIEQAAKFSWRRAAEQHVFAFQHALRAADVRTPEPAGSARPPSALTR